MGFWWWSSSETEEVVPKRPSINLADPYAVKRALDEAASEAVLERGYAEDVSSSNVKLLLGVSACAAALVAQFFPWKFPDSWPLLYTCIALYVILNIALQFVGFVKEKNHILFTHPVTGSVTQTGLAISSTLPRFSDLYTLKVESADPKSIAAKPSVSLTKTVTKWFTSDGILAERVFLADVKTLLDEYEGESRKTK
eukprot:TRINITY_DN38346_c0_g1_i1.p1 TRINITY_DN38346_c0_g1~~TRINITY_DN38346_c0_g1_i1.p1  ORF type:complete len:197 (+),score=40.85 TRINITY_DN38346_c0_g1_i1:231-821(+)